MPCNTCKEAHGYEKVVAPVGHVASVVGAAFGFVVEAFADVLLSLFGKVAGNPGLTNITRGGVPVGASLTATVAFLIVAAVVYFFVVTPYEAAVRVTEVDAGRTRRLSCSPSLVICSPAARRSSSELSGLLVLQRDQGPARAKCVFDPSWRSVVMP